VPLTEALLETRRSPLLLILAGSAPYMPLQSFLHKDLTYSIRDLCIETQRSPWLLIRAGSASCMSLQSFPHKELAYSILVWLIGFLSGPCRSERHSLR
jgi:hypothetical protein